MVPAWVKAGKYKEVGVEATTAKEKRKEKEAKEEQERNDGGIAASKGGSAKDKEAAAAAAAALKEIEAEEAVPHAYTKTWEEMSMVERSYASDSFVKKGLSSKSTLGLLFKMVMGVDAPLMAVGVVGSLLNAIGQAMMPLAIAKMSTLVAESMIPFADKEALLAELKVEGNDFLVVLALIGIGRFLFNGFVEVSGSRVICRVQRLAFASMLQQESAYFDKNKVGELTSLLSTNPGMMRGGMTTGLATTVGGIVQLILVIVFMNHQATGNPAPAGISASGGFDVGSHHHNATRNGAHHLFGITMGTGSPCLLSFMVLFSAMTYFAKRQTEVSQLANGVATEMLGSINTVTAYNMGQKAENQYSAHVNHVMKLGVQKDFVQAVCSVILWWSWLGTQGGIWFFGGRLAINGEITFEFLMSFAGLFTQLLMAMLQIFGAIPGLGSAVGSATKVFGVMIRHPALQNHVGLQPDDCHGDISFEAIDFSYPTRTKQQIFNKVSFLAPPGKSVALAGESGCGKSSILRLLQRNYEPTNGQIRLDGVNIKALNPAWLRSQIGVVSQEPVLFSGTVEENIVAGRKGMDKETVVKAAKLADAHGFITAMAEGYDTLVLEGGTSLSGGQKQRVAIARAIASDPKILIFDEATSALDRKAAAEIQRAIASVSKGRTTLTVAHSAAAIKDSELIHVIADQTIVESGTHEELANVDGSAYNRLFNP